MPIVQMRSTFSYLPFLQRSDCWLVPKKMADWKSYEKNHSARRSIFMGWSAIAIITCAMQTGSDCGPQKRFRRCTPRSKRKQNKAKTGNNIRQMANHAMRKKTKSHTHTHTLGKHNNHSAELFTFGMRNEPGQIFCYFCVAYLYIWANGSCQRRRCVFAAIRIVHDYIIAIDILIEARQTSTTQRRAEARIERREKERGRRNMKEWRTRDRRANQQSASMNKQWIYI